MSDTEILIVQSKVKDYIRGKSEMNTSGGVAVRLSEVVKQLCDRAIENAKTDGRKTVMDRDIPPVA
jgi:histone H3/H4